MDSLWCYADGLVSFLRIDFGPFAKNSQYENLKKICLIFNFLLYNMNIVRSEINFLI